MPSPDPLKNWLKLHRCLLESAIASQPEYLALWVTLLMLAHHTEKQAVFNESKIALKPGSFITSRLKLSAQSGIEESKIERILKYLKSEQQIEQENLSTGRLISITNWAFYQKTEQDIEQPVNSQRTASEQPVNTIKNVRRKEGEKQIVVNVQGNENHSFRDDPNFDFEVFFEATRSVPTMKDWSRQYCMEIHQAMSDWSAARSDRKRTDWLAVARTFNKTEAQLKQAKYAGPRRSQLTFDQQKTQNTISAVENFGKRHEND